MEAPNLKYLIDDCDRGNSRWTKYLTWQDDVVSESELNRFKRRFCLHQNKECMFEEKFVEHCCKKSEICGNYLPPCNKVPLE